MRLLWLLVFTVLAGCTSHEPPPSEDQYNRTSFPLIEASHKMADEPDVFKLHKVSLALDATRTLACNDYNGECNQFAAFLSLAIKASAKGTLTSEERAELQHKAAEIEASVKAGKKRIHEELGQH